MSSEHRLSGVAALLIGVPIGLVGISFPWWKEKISAAARDWIGQQANRCLPFFLSLAFVCLVGPNIYPRAVASAGIAEPVGRIVWNLEQTARGAGYFLSMIKTGNQEIGILGFQVHGKNNSTDPISQFSGHMRLDLTNAGFPIYLQAQDAEESMSLACFPHPWIPTLPDQTFGIPALADFDVGTYEKPFAEVGKDGIPSTKFLTTFVAFTIILEYDGLKVERRFSREEALKQIDIFERSLNPLSTPHILRKANAARPAPLPLRPFPPQASPVPQDSLLPQKPPISSLEPDATPTATIPRKE